MHNIYHNEQTGQDSFFSVGKKVWHTVGKVLSGHPTSGEAIIHADLGFTVEKRPLFTYDTTNHYANPDTDLIIPEIPVPDYYATVRTDNDTPLGVVGKQYQILQNIEAFSFFDDIARTYGIAYETAGALGNGERIFITATVPGSLRVGKDDEIEKYLLFTNHHGGLGSITVAITPVRVVCQNTLNAALKNVQHVKRFRHCKGAAEKLRNAESIISMLETTFPKLETTFNQLAKVRITDQHVRRLIELAMCPSSEVLHMIKQDRDSLSTRFTNTVDAVVKYSQEHETQLTVDAKGTLWGAYNAVTGFYQNAKDYKTSEQKADAILYDGCAMKSGQRALDLCLDYMAYGPDLFN